MIGSAPPLRLIDMLPVLPLLGLMLELAGGDEGWLSSMTEVYFFKHGESEDLIWFGLYT